MPLRHCGNVFLCALQLHFSKSALFQCFQHQSAICLNTPFMSTWHTKLIISGKRVIRSRRCGPWGSHFTLWHCWLNMHKAWGLYGGLCYNESGIPTTNVLNYNFVFNCLIEWTSNNTEAGKSQLGISIVPVVLFQITDCLHIKRYCKFVLLVRENNKQINDAASHWRSCFNEISIILNLGGYI